MQFPERVVFCLLFDPVVYCTHQSPAPAAQELGQEHPGHGPDTCKVEQDDGGGQEACPQAVERRLGIVIATVKGDVHDIGKNIVRVILENYGFEVIDLGRDVPVETVVNTVREKDVHLVGLSALMTTTLKSMEETIQALHDSKLDCKIMVGGAVLTPEYAKKIGADWYAKDAKQSADIAKEFFGV